MMRSTTVPLAFVLLGCSSTGDSLVVEPAAVSSVAPAVTHLEAETSTTVAAREVGTIDEVASAAEPDNEAEVEVVVLEIHARVMGELFARDERIDGPEVHLQLAHEISTGPLLQRLVEGAAARVLSGHRIAGDGYESSVQSVSVSGDMAEVLDCSRDRSSLYNAQGELLAGAEGYWKVRRVEYVLTDDAWRVNEIFSGGDAQCVPAP